MTTQRRRRVGHDRWCTVPTGQLCRGPARHARGSKRDLALAAIDARWAHAQRAILDPAFAPDVEPLERIVRFFHRAAEHQRGPVLHGCPFGNLALKVSTQHVVIRDKVRDAFDATLIDELADRALDLVGAQHDARREESA